jgi:hypothetical protein
VVEHDAVVVVGDLALVAELDRLAEAALGDRPGVAVVQADPPAGAVGGDAGEPLPGLRGDPAGRLQQPGQVIDRAGVCQISGVRPFLVSLPVSYTGILPCALASARY